MQSDIENQAVTCKCRSADIRVSAEQSPGKTNRGKFASDLVLVLKHIQAKASDGLWLGLSASVLMQLQTFERLTKDMEQLFTTLNASLVCIAAASVYVVKLDATKAKPFARRFLPWIDVVQQFFCLGLGFYPTFKIGKYAMEAIDGSASTFDLAGGFIVLGIFVLGSVVFGGVWVLKDENKKEMSKFMEAIYFIAFFLYIYLAIMVSKSGNGFIDKMYNDCRALILLLR